MIDQVGHIGWLGWITFAIVVGSLFFTIMAAILSKPWKPKVTLLVLISMSMLAVAFVLAFWFGGLVFSAFIP